MAVESTLPLLMAQQMGPAARLVHEVATHPEVAQTMARQMSEALLQQESQQVQKPEQTDLSAAVRDENEGGSKGGRHALHERRARTEPEPESASSPSTEGPFLGNLVNRKV